MKIITEKLTIAELKGMSAMFGNMVKAVVDVNREVIAVEAELHSDLEALLLVNGSEQKDLWGINLYPDLSGEDFIEFDSLINLRPYQSNMSRSVEDAAVRKRISQIAGRIITQ